MATLQNSHWRLSVDDTTLCIVFEDLTNHCRWSSAKPFSLCYGHFYTYDLLEHCQDRAVSADGDAIHISLSGMSFFGRFRENPYCKPEPGPDLRFQFTLSLEGAEAVFAIEPVEGMDDETLELSVLSGLMSMPSDRRGGALIPNGYGCVVRFPRGDSFALTYGFNGPWAANMPLALLYASAAPGLFAYATTPWDMSFRFSVNQGGQTAAYAPVFEFERQLANERREVRFAAMAPGQDYNDAAALYRQTLVKRGMFKTYQQKIQESPDAARLVGSVVWKHNVFSTPTSPRPHSYSLYMPAPDADEVEGLPNDWTAREVFDTAHAKGFDRVCVFNTGWNWLGYDSGYPRRLPPNPERGTPRQFTEMAEYARSLSDGFIYSVHDNYIDLYRNSGESLDGIVARTQDQAPLRGGIWRGGRAFIQCTQCAGNAVERDIPKIAAMLGKGSIYIDVFGCTLLHRCYSAAHPMSKRQDADARRRLFQFIVKHIGTAATEAAPYDFLCDTVHLGAFAPFCVSPAMFKEEPAVPVPFWQLVFHDSVLGYTCEGAFGPVGREYMAYQALYALLPTQFDDESLALSRTLRKTYASQMLRHEIGDDVTLTHHGDKRTPDITGTFRTTFADGTTVTAIFAPGNRSSYSIERKSNGERKS